MLHHIDLHSFLESRQRFDNRLQKAINEERELDKYLIFRIGLVSSVICLILQLIAVIIGTVIYKLQDQVFLSVLFLIEFQIFKYVLGGFGGFGNAINSVKLLLGLFAVWFYSKIPSFSYFEFAFDWCNDSILSQIEVLAFLLTGGLMLGISLATYVKARGEEILHVYNRFVAGFNAGIAIAFSILFLICSFRPSNNQAINNSDESVVATINSVEVAESRHKAVPDTVVLRDEIEAVPEVVAGSIDEEVAVSDLSPIKFSGKIGDSPIVVELSVNGNDITGKYAYKSTLRKYGDKPESYFYLSGNIDNSGNMNLESRMHKSNDIFEYITLPSQALYNRDLVEGKLVNANTEHTYILELQME